jgi:hypothetical protein
MRAQQRGDAAALAVGLALLEGDHVSALRRMAKAGRSMPGLSPRGGKRGDYRWARGIGFQCVISLNPTNLSPILH